MLDEHEMDCVLQAKALAQRLMDERKADATSQLGGSLASMLVTSGLKMSYEACVTIRRLSCGVRGGGV